MCVCVWEREKLKVKWSFCILMFVVFLESLTINFCSLFFHILPPAQKPFHRFSLLVPLRQWNLIAFVKHLETRTKRDETSLNSWRKRIVAFKFNIHILTLVTTTKVKNFIEGLLRGVYKYFFLHKNELKTAPNHRLSYYF